MPVADPVALASFIIGDWPEGEKSFVKWQLGYTGSFTSALWEALTQADDLNLARLALGFPAEVDALRQWRSGDLRKRLTEAGVDL